MSLRRYLTALLVLGVIVSGLACASDASGPTGTATRVKLFVDADGFYRVSGAELARAGAPVTQIDTSLLKLFRRDTLVPIRVSGSGESLAIDFYGSTSASPDSPFAAYALRWDAEPGTRIRNTASASAAGPSQSTSVAATSYTDTFTESHPSLY